MKWPREVCPRFSTHSEEKRSRRAPFIPVEGLCGVEGCVKYLRGAISHWPRCLYYLKRLRRHKRKLAECDHPRCKTGDPTIRRL